MEGFIKGDVVVVPFPFTDLSGDKRRPALVITTLTGDDIILCQITGQNRIDQYIIKLEEADFIEGKFKVKNSNIRPNRLFTADKQLIVHKIDKITDSKMKEVIKKIIEIIS